MQMSNRFFALVGAVSLVLSAARCSKLRVRAQPNQAEAYYSVGVIDWTETYQPRMEERSKLGLRPDEPLKDKKVCAKLREQGSAAIQDGIDNLNKAIDLRKDYDDAMAYMNLLYR